MENIVEDQPKVKELRLSARIHDIDDIKLNIFSHLFGTEYIEKYRGSGSPPKYKLNSNQIVDRKCNTMMRRLHKKKMVILLNSLKDIFELNKAPSIKDDDYKDANEYFHEFLKIQLSIQKNAYKVCQKDHMYRFMRCIEKLIPKGVVNDAAAILCPDMRISRHDFECIVEKYIFRYILRDIDSFSYDANIERQCHFCGKVMDLWIEYRTKQFKRKRSM